MATLTRTASALLIALCATAARAERIGLGTLQLPAGEQVHGARMAEWLREGVAALPGATAEVMAPSSCAPDEGRCLATSARSLQLDQIVTAAIEARPSGYRFVLRRFGKDGASAGETRGEVDGGPLDLFGSLENGACTLLGRAPCAGDISITSDGASGAHVYVDGRDAGVLPLAKPLTVPIGRHSVRVGGSFERVRISFGRTAALGVAMRAGSPEVMQASGVLASAPPPAAPAVMRGLHAPDAVARGETARLLFATGLGLAAAGAGLGLWAHVEGGQLDARYRARALTDADKPRYGQVHTAGIAATALLVTGAGALAAGSVVFLLTPQGPAVAGRF